MIRFVVTHVNLWDQQLLHGLFGWHGKRIFDRFFYILSRSADGQLYVVIGIFLAAMNRPAERSALYATVIAFILELTLYKLLKNGIRRPRPFDASHRIHFLIAPPDKFSFPSGHTAAAFLMAVILSSCYAELYALFFIWASLVGISRIYLGVHYPTDVMMGALIGTLTAMVGLSI